MSSARSQIADDEFARLIGEARDRHLLSDIAGRHTTLKKRGSRELVGLCPFHQERSPSFEVNDAKGTYHCHGCGAGGDAITLLVKLESMSFRQAVETLSGNAFPVISDEDRAQRKAHDARQTYARIDAARAIWSSSVLPAGTPAEVYARSRGITMDLPPTVRFVSAPRWRNDETGEVGRNLPAMACALQNVTGAVVGVQCVFLDDGGRKKYERIRPDGTKAKAKLSFGQIVGSALRLGPVADHVVICEGPEDGLSLRQQMPAQSVWVSCGTAMMPRMGLPSEVSKVTLAGDNGNAGREAVSLSGASLQQRGIAVREIFPDPAFKDWNDELRGIRA